MKKPSAAETLKLIQKTRIPFGPNDRSRFVEHTCEALAESRIGPGASADMIGLDDHEANDEVVSFIELINYVAENPVLLWNGECMARLSPGEAAYRILTAGDAEITMLRRRGEPVSRAAPKTTPKAAPT